MDDTKDDINEITKFNFCIDRGGTFTDVYSEIPSKYHNKFGKNIIIKLLSVDKSYNDAPTEGIRRILKKVTNNDNDYGINKPIRTDEIGFIRMGTTVATNALLERQGEPIALLITKGFKDVLHIGNQNRPDIFDLKINRPGLLYKKVYEINERVRIKRNMNILNIKNKSDVVIGSTKEEIYIEKHIDKIEVQNILNDIKKQGILSIAIVLMHSYTFDKHEQIIYDMAMKMKCFNNVSMSSKLLSMIKLVSRGQTTCADAYLTPKINEYLNKFKQGFDSDFDTNVKVTFMQSDGGLCDMNSFNGYRAVLSGPAGGVVGYGLTTYPIYTKGIIGFDMGGTSTDVSRYDGEYDITHDNLTAGIQLQAPQLDISTVAAGGGSILKFEGNMMHVGPESSKAYPGPTCYKNDGPISVTDANLILGRILPQHFPKIFGAKKNEALSKELSIKGMNVIRDQINKYNNDTKFAALRNSFKVNTKIDYCIKGDNVWVRAIITKIVDDNKILVSYKYNDKQFKDVEVDRNSKDIRYVSLSVYEVAMGFIEVANESMCRPIRNITMGRGFDTSKHILATFGGAGGQHACAIARSLGITKVFIHKYSGILSAYGMGLADVNEEQQITTAYEFSSTTMKEIIANINDIKGKCVDKLIKDGYEPKSIITKPYLNLRFKGSNVGIFVPGEPLTDDCKSDNEVLYKSYKEEFVKRYKREYGFVLERDIIVDTVRCVSIAKGAHVKQYKIAKRNGNDELKEIETTKAYFDVKGEVKCLETKVYDFNQLKFGDSLLGPAIILQNTSTIVIEPNCCCLVTTYGDIEIRIGNDKVQEIDTSLNNVRLAIFGHRFMSIAEQMGRALERTSVSTNIKERKDFSCAIFGPNGGLIANAPHLPVHLGSMQDAVRYQVKYWTNDDGTVNIKEGDVLVSNHPKAGGTHLPDITVITPVFNTNAKKPIFWLASRGHHADIGGIAPGSMPPFSKYLSEEGVAIEAFKLVKNGLFQEDDITKLLVTPNALGGTEAKGTRNLSDNISDLKAQIAANNKGIELMNILVDEYKLSVVQAYMKYIQDNAEEAVREMLKQTAVKYRHLNQNDDVDGKVDNDDSKYTVLNGVDYMDDGTPIQVKITINSVDGSAVFDFKGTGAQVYGNCNAPKAVTYSAIIYCMRCLVGLNNTSSIEIPLNQGCLIPIKVIIPDNTILNPSLDLGIVGGNVLTSQRVTDVILKAFNACAASQGCMNNLTFGNNKFGYYETIAGGAGAGPDWVGVSGVHTHMTNTRITDAEILERRYPVCLRQFSLRSNSGGIGKFNGGNGVIRKIEFCDKLLVSILSERRSYEPYGLNGGGNGKTGVNIIKRKRDNVKINIGSKRTYKTDAGDEIHIFTPGGGAYGKVS